MREAVEAVATVAGVAIGLDRFVDSAVADTVEACVVGALAAVVT